MRRERTISRDLTQRPSRLSAHPSPDCSSLQWCFVDSDDHVPPPAGWSVTDACSGPPPTISSAAAAAVAPEAGAAGGQGAQETKPVASEAVARSATPVAATAQKEMRTSHASCSVSRRRKKRLQDNKFGIKKKRRVKLK